MQKRGGSIQAIADVIKTLAAGEILERKYKDHPLSGNYAHCRECHVEPDLLLVYRYTGELGFRNGDSTQFLKIHNSQYIITGPKVS